MTNVFDVAKYILHKKGRMSTLKLQKLCYYAQAWSLAWDDSPLFNEDFEAWANGPVCRRLFNIRKGSFDICEDNIIDGNLSHEQFSKEQIISIGKVIDYYGDITLTCSKIKQYIELPLSKEEQLKEAKFLETK